MKKILFAFLLSTFLGLTTSNLFCPKTSNSPRDIVIDTSFKITAEFSNINYSTVIVNNQVYFKNSTKVSISNNYYDSTYCPTNLKFYLPTKENYESLIAGLGKEAYSTLTDPNGFNMTENKYFLTKNKTSSGNFTCMYLSGKTVKIGDFNLKYIPVANISINCRLKPQTTANLVYSGDFGEIQYDTKTTIKTDNPHINGHVWRIDQDKYYKNSVISPKFTQSGRHRIELWARVVSGEIIYLCDYIYAKKKPVSSSQSFSNSKVKKIETGFKVTYTNKLHFERSNSAVAPRADGGYYVAFSDNSRYLHILSYDKDDNLIKDFNTQAKGYILDITTTDYGFAIYIRNADNANHSYLSLYNKFFELINTITIMNNDINNKLVDSDISKQIIKYDSSGSPVFGMRFMYEPHNGKLIYSRGRVFLIFAHYNHFMDDGGHTGDTVVTFNDVLKDMDFGETWGSSHSLIQSVTTDDLFFWSAALSDAYPEGIKVEYTSKKTLLTSSYDYDPINKKYNSRLYHENNKLAGYITPYHNGQADGKLGGILYYEKLGLYVMVYAKTPVASTETDGGKNIMYATLWKFTNNKITDIQTKIVKNFGEDNNVMQLRAGKYGDDKLFIIYAPTTTKGSHVYGNVPRGTVPKLFIIELPSFKISKNDIQIDDLLMNTNDEIRTFQDGVLIWATANAEGNLTINKVGDQRLDESYDDINYKITKDDLKDVDNEYNKKDEGEWCDGNDDNDGNGKNNNKKSPSGGQVFAIVFFSIIGIIILVIGVFLLYKYISYKKSGKDFNLGNIKNEMLLKN